MWNGRMPVSAEIMLGEQLWQKQGKIVVIADFIPLKPKLV
jgi:hypothetical protein